jgi:non-heme chloroperoxidase
MPYFKAADETRLFYYTWGSGHPVIFVHGGNSGADFWEFQVPSLKEKSLQCIVYSQRGFAKSDCPSTGYEADTLASDLDKLIRHLNVSQCSVVTYSFGACVLARYLSRYGSEKVDKAILVATTTPFLLRTASNPEGMDRGTAYEPFRAGMLNDRAQLFRDSLDAFFSPGTAEHAVTDGIKEWMMTIALGSPLLPMLELNRTMSETDFRNDMKSFSMPTLIVQGDSDVFAPPACTGMRTHNMIPGSRLLIYAGASHGLFFTHRARLNADIAKFIAAGDSDRQHARKQRRDVEAGLPRGGITQV